METTERPCLNDQNEFPDDEVLERHLGKTKGIWDSFIQLLTQDFPSFQSEWRYYKDGKSWLLKVTKKKKTICWVSVFPKRFKIGFYFSDKAKDLIENSELKQEYKDQFTHGKYYGKIKGITVEVNKPPDLEMTRILIEIKEKMK